MLDRDSCTQLIEQDYFGCVASGNLTRVMDCFTEDARIVIRHGDNPERHFLKTPGNDNTDLARFYRHLCDNYTCWFGDFEHYIDIERDRAASRFSVRLSPKKDGQYADYPDQSLRNCNFFEFHDGKISHMIIYYANPDNRAPGSKVGTKKPTGYPPG